MSDVQFEESSETASYTQSPIKRTAFSLTEVIVRFKLAKNRKRANQILVGIAIAAVILSIMTFRDRRDTVAVPAGTTTHERQ